MKLKLKDPMIITARVEGKQGRIRELSALLDFNTHFTWIFRLDALHLGYPEVNHRPEDYKSFSSSSTGEILSLRGIELSIQVQLTKISIGKLSASNIRAFILPLNVPLDFPIDLILGRSFLDKFRVVFDPKAGYLSLT
jgi:hypothetical protein